jgi:hypothetical protein
MHIVLAGFSNVSLWIGGKEQQAVQPLQSLPLNGSIDIG